jgi:hypothetical protein
LSNIKPGGQVRDANTVCNKQQNNKNFPDNKYSPIKLS